MYSPFLYNTILDKSQFVALLTLIVNLITLNIKSVRQHMAYLTKSGPGRSTVDPKKNTHGRCFMLCENENPVKKKNIFQNLFACLCM